MTALMLITCSLSMTSCKKEEGGSSGDETSSQSSKGSKNSSKSAKEQSSSSKEGSSSSKSSSSSKEDSSSNKEGSNSSKDGSSSSKSGKEASSSDTSTSSSVNSEAAGLAALPTPPNADQFKSKNIYIINLDSGKPVYATGEDERIPPASITKVMTCLMALEFVENLDTETAILSTDINNYLYTQRVDTLGGIAMGESFSIRDLLYAMMLQSANDAAMMVGKYVSTKDKAGRAPEDGDLEVFVQMMNEKAKEIGAINTHFSNPTGLADENNYSTAKDLALITKYAWENTKYGETFQEIVTTNAYTSKPTTRMPKGITWYSTVYPQQSSQTKVYKSYIRGIKTGSLPGDENLHNYVSVATQDGYSYLASICNAPIKDPETGRQYELNLSFVDTGKLYDWCFDTFQVKALKNVGDLVTSVGVNLAWDVESVDLIAADKFATLVTTETTADNVTLEPVFPSAKTRTNKNKEIEYYFDAPIKKGQELGYVKIKTANLELGRVRLVAAKNVERSDWLYYMEKVKDFMGKFVFKFLLTLSIVFVVLYILLMVIRNHNKKRYRTRGDVSRARMPKRTVTKKKSTSQTKRPPPKKRH